MAITLTRQPTPPTRRTATTPSRPGPSTPPRSTARGEAEVRALDGVNVEFATARFTAIMGPSGSGKSTLMHSLAGLDSLTSGSVWIGDVELGQLKEKKLTQLRRDRIGFIFQSFNLIPTLTAIENVTLPMKLAGRKPDQEWLDTVVDTVGLGNRLHHRPSELSGGQQQRVAVARALAGKPHIVFADEPTGNLDSRTGAEILAFMRQAVRELGQTIVMVTHDPVAAVVLRPRGVPRRRSHRRRDRRPHCRQCLRPHPDFGRSVMFKLTIKSIRANPARFLLTGVAVILGVAFMAGTLVLTDTIKKSYDDITLNVYKSTDAVVRSASQVKSTNGGTDVRGTVDASVLATVRATPGVKAAEAQQMGVAVVRRAQRRVARRQPEPVGPGRARLAERRRRSTRWRSSPVMPRGRRTRSSSTGCRSTRVTTCSVRRCTW